MTTTKHLNIPLVEESSTMSKQLWNNAFEQIDNVCMGFIDLGTFLIQFNGSTQATIQLSTENIFRFIDIFSENPSNQQNWKAIARASIRCYQDEQDSKKIHFVAEGIIPTNEVTIRMIGWY